MNGPIAPGSTIGILGGGQLGRMLAMAARPLGYRVRVLDPDPHCSAAPVSDGCVTAPFSDVDAALRLAHGCDVVTLEIEKISLDVLRAVERVAPVRPGPEVLRIVQDRAVQKRWLVEHGFPVGPFRVVQSEDEAADAARALGPCFLKAAFGGYDGRGQVEVDDLAAARAGFAWLGGHCCVAEQALALVSEISVMVARSANGQTAVFPPSRNLHEARILAFSVLPAQLGEELERRAADIARDVASAIGMVGLLAVEMFVMPDGALLVNELAPRPHNTFHTTEFACATGQFEQGIRAVCGLPLGDVDVVRPTALANVLGDLWAGGNAPPFAEVLGLPGVKLHLYGKLEARPGRKMGHLCATGATADEALARVRAAWDRLNTHALAAASAH